MLLIQVFDVQKQRCYWHSGPFNNPPLLAFHQSTSFASPLSLAENCKSVDTGELDFDEDIKHEVLLVFRVRGINYVWVDDPKSLDFANIKIINEEFALVSLKVDAVFAEDQATRH